jgi:hypothetical protein
VAITTDGFFGSITLVDNGNNLSTLQYALTGGDFATALADLQGIVTLLEAVTDAVVKGYRVGEAYSEKALSLPAGGVQVENVASISALITGFVDKYAIIKIPAPKAGIFTGSSGDAANVIDANDADLAAYLGTFLAAGEATVSDGETIQAVSTATVKGKRIHRASRKG